MFGNAVIPTQPFVFDISRNMHARQQHLSLSQSKSVQERMLSHVKAHAVAERKPKHFFIKIPQISALFADLLLTPFL